MKVFVPISDEMLMQGTTLDDLAVYQPGMPCLSNLKVPLDATQSRSTTSRSPGSTPNSAAVPAFNSSTNLAGNLLGYEGQ